MCKVRELLKDESSIDIGKFFEGLSSIMMEHVEIYSKIAKTKKYMFLITDFKNILKSSIVESFHKKSNMKEEVINIYSEYIATGIVNIYIDWLNYNTGLTLEELINIAKGAVLSGGNKIFKDIIKERSTPL